MAKLDGREVEKFETYLEAMIHILDRQKRLFEQKPKKSIGADKIIIEIAEVQGAIYLASAIVEGLKSPQAMSRELFNCMVEKVESDLKTLIGKTAEYNAYAG